MVRVLKSVFALLGSMNVLVFNHSCDGELRVVEREVLRKLFQSTKCRKPLFIRQQSETAKQRTSPDLVRHFLLIF